MFSILVLALGLRLWGINFGLPQFYMGDEGALIGAAMYSGSHRLEPVRLMYGQLIPYVLLVEYGAYFLLGFLFGKFDSVNDFFVSYIQDPTYLLLLGRVTMALVGVAIVYLVYVVGKKFYNQRIGLIAALFLATAFLAVKESHYLKEGNLASLFTLLSYYFILKILNGGKKRDYLGAGIALGLGLGAKYESILVMPLFLIVYLWVNRGVAISKLKYFFLGLVTAIFITFPYLFINPSLYIQKFIAEFKLTTTVYPLYLQNKPIWWWFFFIHTPQGLGLPLFWASVVGFIISIVRGSSNKNYFFIPIMPAVFLITIDYWQKFHNARYALIVLPFYCLGAAILIDWISKFIKNKGLNYFILTNIVILLSFVSLERSIKFNIFMTKPDTRSISKLWIEKNLPAGSAVLVETMIRPEYPANINVPLFLDAASIERYYSEAKASGYPGTYLTALKTATLGQVGYDLIATSRANVAKDLVTDVPTTLKDAYYWVEQKVDYLVISSWHAQPDITSEFQTSIDDNYKLIKEFRPLPEFPDDPHFVQMDYQTLDSIDLFRQDLLFGPKIQIYKLRKS